MEYPRRFCDRRESEIRRQMPQKVAAANLSWVDLHGCSVWGKFVSAGGTDGCNSPYDCNTSHWQSPIASGIFGGCDFFARDCGMRWRWADRAGADGVAGRISAQAPGAGYHRGLIQQCLPRRHTKPTRQAHGQPGNAPHVPFVGLNDSNTSASTLSDRRPISSRINCSASGFSRD